MKMEHEHRELSPSPITLLLLFTIQTALQYLGVIPSLCETSSQSMAFTSPVLVRLTAMTLICVWFVYGAPLFVAQKNIMESLGSNI